MKPYADDTAVETVDELSIENGTDSIVMHGTLEVTRDKRGLSAIRELKMTVDAIAAALEGQADLPDVVAAVEPSTETFKNPFE